MTNCLHVSETSALQKKYSGEKFWKSMLPALIMIPMQKALSCSSNRYKTKCTGLPTSIPLAEVIYERADAEKENMGLTSWEHNEIRRSDVEVAKNYLTEQELDALNKIVTAYLDIAEVHALNKEPMYMKDWLETIDNYLKMTRRDILTSSGHISHKQAIEKAHAEYDKYKNRLDDTLSPVEKDFIESIGMLEQITDSSKK